MALADKSSKVNVLTAKQDNVDLLQTHSIIMLELLVKEYHAQVTMSLPKQDNANHAHNVHKLILLKHIARQSLVQEEIILLEVYQIK